MESREMLEVRGGVSRRTFIKGVIAAGATVSSTSYLFRGAGPRACAERVGGRWAGW